jgi:hypothetical protein
MIKNTLLLLLFTILNIINFFNGENGLVLANELPVTRQAEINSLSSDLIVENQLTPAQVHVLAQPTSKPTEFSVTTPFVISTSLSADGRYCTLVFDSPTNKGGISSSNFPCTNFLLFPKNEVATCFWSDASTIAVYPDLTTAENIAEALNVGSAITLLADNGIYSAKCGTGLTSSMPSACVPVMQQSLFVLGPLSPIPPTVSIKTSLFISACAPWRLDLTESTGDGQRGWRASASVVSSNKTENTASLRNFVAAHANMTKVPLSVPAKYLNIGSVYTVTITLCNIFLDCDSETAVVTVTNGQSSAPSVSVVGSNSLPVIYTKTPITLNAIAYTVGCGGSTSSVGLTFNWKVKQGGAQVNVPSTVRGASIMVAPFALTTGLTYTFEVTVNDPSTSLFTISSTSLVVSASALVSTITSTSSMQLLRAGRSLTLLGSTSSDPDDPTNQLGDLSYAWACPGSTSTVCPLSSTSLSSSASYTLSADTSAINKTAIVTLTVSKEGRTASSSVAIKIIEGNAPLITMQTTSTAVASVNTANSLLLSALINSDYSVGCSWSVSPAGSLDLTKVALTSTNKQVLGQTPTLFNLFLAGNALSVRATYQFALTCYSSSSSIVVTTNGPPIGGIYEITPKEGTEMSTTFQYSTTQWSDPDLPITYLFGFVNAATGLLSTVQSRSVLTYASSSLPGGSSSSGFGVATIMRVFDNLNASSQLNITVLVNPLSASAASSAITTQLANAAGSTNLDDIKAVISVASSVISRADCTGVTGCNALHRAECSTTSSTCGPCLSGYIGQSGDGNSACVSSVVTGPVTIQQKCPNDCSGHGRCAMFASSTGLEQSTCSIIDTSCSAACVCDSGFAGTSCVSEAALASSQALRSSLLNSLSLVIDNEDATADSVGNVISSVSGILQNPSDVNNHGLTTFHTIATTTLTNSLSSSEINSEVLSGLLGPVDIAMKAQTSSGNATGALSMGNTILSAFSSIVERDAVVGLPASTYTYSNFKLAQQTLAPSDGKASLSLKPTSIEQAADLTISSVSVIPTSMDDSSTSISVSLLQYDAKLLGGVNASSKYSNIMTSSFSIGDSEVEIKLANTLGKLGPSRSTSIVVNFTTNCQTADYGKYNLTCPLSGKTLFHTCRGTKGKMVSYCPVLTTVCNSVDLETGLPISSSTQGYDCRLNGMTAADLTCLCKPLPGRRRLTDGALQKSGVLSAVAMSQYTAYQVGETFKAAPELTSPKALERAMIVIILFAVLWAGGLTLMCGCFLRQRQLTHEALEKKLDEAGRIQQNLSGKNR